MKRGLVMQVPGGSEAARTLGSAAARSQAVYAPIRKAAAPQRTRRPLVRRADSGRLRHARRPRRLRRRSRSLPSRCPRRAGSGHSPSARSSAPASLAALATTSAIGVLPSITNSWLTQRVFLAELGDRALDHLGDDVGGLAALGRLFGRDRALALDQVAGRGRLRRAPAGRPRRCASRSACPAPRARRRGASLSSATSTPILPRPGAAALWT